MGTDSLYLRLSVSARDGRPSSETSITEAPETLDRDFETTLAGGFIDQVETMETKAVETVDNDVIAELAGLLDSRATAGAS